MKFEDIKKLKHNYRMSATEEECFTCRFIVCKDIKSIKRCPKQHGKEVTTHGYCSKYKPKKQK